MKISIALFLVIASVAITKASYNQELLKKYGLKKIFESCFGPELSQMKIKEFKEHIEVCKGGSLDKNMSPVVRKAFDWNAVFRQQEDGSGSIFLPVPVAYNQSPFFSRQKRSQGMMSKPYFNEDKVRNLKNIFLEKMKLAACVLQRMNIIDANMNMQWTKLRSLYSELNIEPELKEDLLEVNKKCQQFVTCIPFDEKKLGTFPLGLKQAFIYFKCELKKKVEVCMKKDLRKKADMFELQGLDGLLDHLDEDEEKMLKVLKINSKFGDEDMDIFY